MEQFSAEGLAPGGVASAGRAAASHAPHVTPRVPASAVSEEMKLGRAGQPIAAGRQFSREQERQASLQSKKSLFQMPAQMEMFGMFAGGLGLTKISSFIKIVFPVDALRATSIGTLFTNPKMLVANWFHSVAANAGGMGARGQKIAASAAKKAQAWEAAAKSGAVKAAAPITGTLPSWLQSVADWSERVAAGRHSSHVEKALKAATTERHGFFTRIKNFVLRRTPATVHPGELAPIVGEISAAHALTGAARVERLDAVVKTLHTQVESNAFKDPELGRRAGELLTKARKALGSAHVHDALSSAGQGGFGNMLRTFVKAASKVSIFKVLIGAGVVAGLGATYYKAKHEANEISEAKQLLETYLDGDHAGQFAQAIYATQAAQSRWHIAKTGIETVGEIADGMLWANPHGAGAAVMTAQLLPAGVSMFVPDHPELSCVVALHKDEIGEITLSKEDKAKAYVTLMAKLPSVAKAGGIYNHLAKAVAHEFAERNLSPKEAFSIINNHEAFTKIATEVSEKKKATEAAVLKDQPKGEMKPEIKQEAAPIKGAEAKQEVHAAHVAAVGSVAPEMHPQAHHAKAETTHRQTAETAQPAHAHGHAHHEAANAPTMKIGQAEHKGHVAERHLAVENG